MAINVYKAYHTYEDVKDQDHIQCETKRMEEQLQY